MNTKINNLELFLNFRKFCTENRFLFDPTKSEINLNAVSLYKAGHKIHIKKLNRGKFTEYCGGKVTSECIQRGKHSSDPKIRKRATFAANARKWKHGEGGSLLTITNRLADFSYIFNTKR